MRYLDENRVDQRFFHEKGPFGDFRQFVSVVACIILLDTKEDVVFRSDVLGLVAQVLIFAMIVPCRSGVEVFLCSGHFVPQPMFRLVLE